MSDPAGSKQAGAVEPLRQVRATFASSGQMQDAVGKLSLAGFDRADLSLPSPGLVQGAETPEAGTKAASTSDDAQQMRTLGASTAASAVALAAAGITIATGGAAAPAVAAALVAGGVTGGGVFFAHGVANQVEQQDRDERASEGDLVLAVHATTEAKRAEAESIMRAAGATQVETID